MNNKLYVGNLSFETTEASLRELFSKSGNIRSVSVIMDRATNQPRGFAFVEMETADEAKNAIQMYDGQDLDGRTLKVNEAKPAGSGSGGNSGSKSNNYRSKSNYNRY